MYTDTEQVLSALAQVLESAGLGGMELPVLAYGRSIGACCAVHAASHRPDLVKAVIVESGLQTIKRLPMIEQFVERIPGGSQMLSAASEPVRTARQLVELSQPVLFVHGDRDELVPMQHAVTAHDECQSTWKKLHVVPGASHNDLHRHCGDTYWELVSEVLEVTHTLLNTGQVQLMQEML